MWKKTSMLLAPIGLTLLFTASAIAQQERPQLKAGEAPSLQAPTKEEVEARLYQYGDASTVAERLLEISESFIETPYQLGPCGEGEFGVYDPKPLTCFTVFDCTTFVEAVLALGFVEPTSEDPFGDFIQHLKEIKYCDAKDPCFANRNHFVSIQWHPNAISKGYLTDVTREIYPSFTPYREKWLDIHAWYDAKVAELEKSSDPDKEKKIADIKRDSPNKRVKLDAKLFYVSLAGLLTPAVKEAMLAYPVLLFNLVKDDHAKANIPVIVGHQGFVVPHNGVLFLRHASSTANQVVDVPLADYVLERLKDKSWPTLGLNLMAIAEKN